MTTVYYALIGFNAIIGILPLIFSKRSLTNSMFFIETAAISLWVLSISQIWHSDNLFFWGRALFVGPIIMPLALLIFVMNYPRPIIKNTWWKTLIILIWPTIMVGLSLSGLIVDEIHLNRQISYEWGYKLFPWYFWGYFGMVFTVGFLGLRNFKGIERLRLAYFQTGYLVFITLASITNVILPMMGNNQLNKYGPLFTPFFLIPTLVAILRYRLMEIRLILKTSLVYLLLFSTAAAVFFGSIVVANRVVSQWIQLPEQATMLVSIIAIILAYPRLKDIFNKWTDKIFFQKQYEYEDIVEAFNQKIAKCNSIQAIISGLLSTLNETFKPCHICLGHASQYFPKTYVRDVMVLPLNQLAPELGNMVRHFKGVMVRDEFEAQLQTLSSLDRSKGEIVLDQLIRLDATICLPISVSAELPLAVVIGDKRSTLPFNSEDILLLETLMNQTNTALQQVGNYEKLKESINNLSFRSQLLQSIHSKLEINTLFKAIFRAFLRQFKFSNAIIGFPSRGGANLMVAAAKPGSDVGVLDIPNHVIFNPTLDHLNVPMKLSEWEKRVLNTDLESVTRFAKAQKATHLCAIRLMVGETEIGVMFGLLNPAEVPQFSAETFQTLAGDVGPALQKAFLYEDIVNIKTFNEDLLNNMDAGIIVLDQDQKIVTFNRQSEALTGLRFKDVFQKSVTVLTKLSSGFSILKKSQEDSTPLKQELSIAVKDTEKSLLLATSVLAGWAERPPQVIGVLSDITATQNLLRQIAQSEKLATIGTIAAGIAHEIKNPLTAIKGLSDMLPYQWENPLFREKYVEIVPPQLDRIKELTESLLRVGTPSTKLKKVFDINRTIKDVVTLLDGEAKTRGAKFTMKTGGPAWIHGDVAELTQVLINLFLNSLQSLTQLEEEEITIQTTWQDDRYTITIQDTGCGIPRDQLDKIFESFFTTKTKGTGLGLTIVAQVIQAHHGSIQVASEEGKGTVFTLDLPAATPVEEQKELA